MTKKGFAAFVITFERSEILPDTLHKILSQTVAPEKVLVIDNSATDKTEKLISTLNNPKVFYHKTGHNAGPAGAAQRGLRLLNAEGFEWIYWGDDNDPPGYPTVFEEIFRILESGISKKTVGILGHRGGKFNSLTGRTSNLSNAELNGIVTVDFITGGQHMIINGDVVAEGALPTEKLFFGFEELDFCLNVKKTGRHLYICGDHWLHARIKSGNTASNYRWKGTNVGKSGSLWRQYYSVRNMLYIQFTNHFYIAMCLLIGKTITKSVLGFKYGLKYGWMNLKIHFLGVHDFIRGTYGLKDLTAFKD